MAQIGIYSLGTMYKHGLSHLVNVVLTKEKGVLVFAMTQQSDDWTYKFVESMVLFDLKTASAIQKFASVLVTSLKWADQSQVH